MKKTALLFSLLAAITFGASAQSQFVKKYMSYNSAYQMPKKKWESGIRQPFRFGLTEKTEIYSTALALPLIPNAGIKFSWGEKGGFNFATSHSLSIPSPVLNILSRKGTGGFISPEFTFPFILSVSNSVMASKPVCDSALLTLKADFLFAIRGHEIDPQSTIDLPVIYPRMAHYYKGSSVRLSASIKTPVMKKLGVEEGLQVFLITRSENNFFAENTGYLYWKMSKKMLLKAGYNLSYGVYPFGKHWQLWPSLDLLFGSRR
jgi:hypothetical protein